MKDKLSALLDGDLDEQSARPVFDALRRERAFRTDWEAYCLIGDVLRGDRDGSPGFVDRVMESLGTEPVVLAPVTKPDPAAGRAWRSLMPLAASVMGVAAVGWVANALYNDSTTAAPPVASAVSRTPVAVVPPSAVRPVAATSVPEAVDPNREYVFAHQSMTAGGPISGVIQHVRTVSDVRQDGAR